MKYIAAIFFAFAATFALAADAPPSPVDLKSINAHGQAFTTITSDLLKGITDMEIEIDQLRKENIELKAKLASQEKGTDK